MIIDNRFYRFKSIFGYRLRALLNRTVDFLVRLLLNYRLTRGLVPRKVLSKLSFISTYSTADQDKPPPLSLLKINRPLGFSLQQFRLSNWLYFVVVCIKVVEHSRRVEELRDAEQRGQVAVDKCCTIFGENSIALHQMIQFYYMASLYRTDCSGLVMFIFHLFRIIPSYY